MTLHPRNTAEDRRVVSDEEAARILRPRYTIFERAGAGASSVVYRVADHFDGDSVLAARVVSLASSDEHPDPRADIVREFELASRFRHPNLVTARDLLILPEQDIAVVTMEYVTGTPFGPNMRGLDIAPLCELMAQLLRGLAFLHDSGLVHADIKPANVLVQRTGNSSTVRLLDYHLAYTAAERPTAARGTLRTMAPEVIAGEGGSPQSDLYSAGVLLCEALIGRPLLSGSARTVADAHLNAPALDGITVPEVLRSFLERLLAKRPGGRFRTAVEAIGSLAEASGQDLRTETAETLLGRINSAPLVGRRTAVEAFRACLNALSGQDDRGRAVVLTGPVGVGRTRTLREWETEAQKKGARTLCLAQASGSLDDVLAWVAGDTQRKQSVAGQSANPDLHLALLDAAAARLVALAEQQPVVLLLDDADALDEAARHSVLFLCRALERCQALVCMAFKGAPPPWTQDVPALAEVTLEPLSEEEARILVDRMLPAASPPLLESLTTAWGGYPGLIASSAAHLVRARALQLDNSGNLVAQTELMQLLPASVEEALGALYEGADASTRACLEVLAVAGGPLRVAHLATAVGLKTDEVMTSLWRQQGNDIFSVRKTPDGTLCSLRQGAFGDLILSRLPENVRQLRYDTLANATSGNGNDSVRSAIYRLRGRTPRAGVSSICHELTVPESAALSRLSANDLLLALGNADETQRPVLLEALGDHAANRASSEDAHSSYKRALDSPSLGYAHAVRLRRKLVEASIRSDRYDEALALRAELKPRLADGPDVCRDVARADLAVAQACVSRGNTAKAMELCVSVEDVGRKISDPALLAAGLALEAQVYQQGDHLDWAERRFEEALVLYRRANDETAAASVLSSLGYLDMLRRRWRQARRRLKEATTGLRSEGRVAEAARAVFNVGTIHHKLCEWDPARRHYEDALALYREIDDRQGTTSVLRNLAQIETSIGAYEDALRHAQEAGRYAAGEPKAECVSLLREGRAHFGIGDTVEAARCAEAALGISQKSRLYRYTESALRLLGESAAIDGQLERAGAYLREALALTREVPLPEMEVVCLLRLAEAELAGGDHAAAQLLVGAAWSRAETIAREPITALVRMVRGKIALSARRAREALADLVAAEGFFSARGECDDIMESSLELAIAYAALGKLRFASICCRRALDAVDQAASQMRSEEHRIAYHADPRRQKLFAAVNALARHRAGNEIPEEQHNG